MLGRTIAALLLLTSLVLADLEEKPVVIVESIAVEDDTVVEKDPTTTQAIAESRIGKAEIPDQLAVESRDHRSQGHQIKPILVPVPVDVRPARLVIPAPPQNQLSQQSYEHNGLRKLADEYVRHDAPPPIFKNLPGPIRGHPNQGHNIVPGHGPPKQNDLIQLPSQHGSHQQPQHNVHLPPPPPPQYQGLAPPPPPQNNYQGPPPPPPQDYQRPPPPPQNNYRVPPQQALQNNYQGPPQQPPPQQPHQNNYPSPSQQPPQSNYQGPPPPPPQHQPQPKPQLPNTGYQEPAPQQPQVAPPPPQYKPIIAPPVSDVSNSLGNARQSQQDSDVSGTSLVQPNSINSVDPWQNGGQEMPKISSLDVKCEKNSMKVNIEFEKPFYGIVFSKGYFSNVNCIHIPAGQGVTSKSFDISINSCGTTGNTENGLYGYGSQSGSGTFFENTIVVQYDPQVQEVWDQARKLRCTWHDQYEKAVTFRPFPVDMLHVVPADFAGDNVGCWMQIQVGKGPWAAEVSGLVKIGQTMTMVLAIKDDDNKFDMLVRNCMAHDGKRAPIQLVDQKGCVTRPKLMSPFTKIKNFGASASVLSYAYFQAFKFPDSMEVHFKCTIQICRYQCPDQCQDNAGTLPGQTYSASAITGRSKRDVDGDEAKDIGVDRIIQVVSTRDLSFIPETEKEIFEPAKLSSPLIEDQSSLICMSTPGFAATLVVLLAILIISCLLSAFLCIRFRGHPDTRSIISSYDNPVFMHKKGHF